MKELIFYVHVPFCSSKCHFCSWVSPIPTSDLVKRHSSFGDYSRAVIREIEHIHSELRDAAIASKLIYFGGGTPSLLDASDLVSILQSVLKHFPRSDGYVNATLEMSPDTATLDKLQALRAGGFDRISFGVQSFDADRSRSIGRAHTPQQAVDAVAMARSAGFDDINIDVMIGFPGETDEECDRNVAAALALQPDHLSVYVFKPAPGTLMTRRIESGRLAACPKPDAVARYQRVARRLAAEGYGEYMFQLFARSGKRCFIDYHYFHLDHDYIGFGQGAHSLLGGTVYGHRESLENYLARPAPDHRSRAADVQSHLETIFFEMLHTDRGVDFARFEAALRIPFDEAVRRHPRLRLAVDSVLRSGGAEQSAHALRFVDPVARVDWLTLPPFWSEPAASAPKTIAIAAAN